MKEYFNHIVTLKLMFMLIYAFDISYHKFFYLFIIIFDTNHDAYVNTFIFHRSAKNCRKKVDIRVYFLYYFYFSIDMHFIRMKFNEIGINVESNSSKIYVIRAKMIKR